MNRIVDDKTLSLQLETRPARDGAREGEVVAALPPIVLKFRVADSVGCSDVAEVEGLVPKPRSIKCRLEEDDLTISAAMVMAGPKPVIYRPTDTSLGLSPEEFERLRKELEEPNDEDEVDEEPAMMARGRRFREILNRLDRPGRKLPSGSRRKHVRRTWLYIGDSYA